jgi:hypothetical protein
MTKQFFFTQMEWEDPPRGYYLTDVKQKTLWVNEETGATWALVRFPPGVADKRHTHPKANQLTLPLRGEIEMPDGSLFRCNGQGVIIFEKGEPHGRTNFPKETVVLFYWDGPPEPEVVE